MVIILMMKEQRVLQKHWNITILVLSVFSLHLLKLILQDSQLLQHQYYCKTSKREWIKLTISSQERNNEVFMMYGEYGILSKVSSIFIWERSQYWYTREDNVSILWSLFLSHSQKQSNHLSIWDERERERCKRSWSTHSLTHLHDYRNVYQDWLLSQSDNGIMEWGREIIESKSLDRGI